MGMGKRILATVAVASLLTIAATGCGMLDDAGRAGGRIAKDPPPIPAAVKDLVGKLDPNGVKDLSDIACNLKNPSEVNDIDTTSGEELLRDLMDRLEKARTRPDVKAYCDWAFPPDN